MRREHDAKTITITKEKDQKPSATNWQENATFQMKTTTLRKEQDADTVTKERHQHPTTPNWQVFATKHNNPKTLRREQDAETNTAEKEPKSIDH